MGKHIFSPATLLKTLGGFLSWLWLACGVILQTLLILMTLDVVTGLLAAFIEKTVSSAASFRGLARKAIVLCIVAASHAFSRGMGHTYGVDLNLCAWISGAFCIHEFLSIIENAGRAGLEIPKPLTDALEKLKGTGERP